MAYGFNDDKSKLDLLDFLHPVGSIYMTADPTDPSEIFGGTWVAWGSGRVPVGVDPTQTEFDTVEETGGEKAHTLSASEMPSHTHTYAKANSPTGSTTLTTNQIPSHSHGLGRIPNGFGTISGSALGTGAVSGITSFDNSLNTYPTGGGQGHTHTIGTTSTASGSAGSGSAHNNLQPYITCYMWKRTA